VTLINSTVLILCNYLAYPNTDDQLRNILQHNDPPELMRRKLMIVLSSIFKFMLRGIQDEKISSPLAFQQYLETKTSNEGSKELVYSGGSMRQTQRNTIYTAVYNAVLEEIKVRHIIVIPCGLTLSVNFMSHADNYPPLTVVLLQR
jgi:hypothetical protein